VGLASFKKTSRQKTATKIGKGKGGEKGRIAKKDDLIANLHMFFRLKKKKEEREGGELGRSWRENRGGQVQEDP